MRRWPHPLRGHLQHKATALGATYHADWEEGVSTHLITAFESTPKAKAVRKGVQVVALILRYHYLETTKRVAGERVIAGLTVNANFQCTQERRESFTVDGTSWAKHC